MTPTFFTDRDLGKQFPAILAAAGLRVERHYERFPPNAADADWLRYVGQRRLVAITHNERIRYTPNEQHAVMLYRVALFVVVGHAPYPELADNFVRTLPRILKFLSRNEPPFIARVSRPAPAELRRRPRAMGSVVLCYPR